MKYTHRTGQLRLCAVGIVFAACSETVSGDATISSDARESGIADHDLSIDSPQSIDGSDPNDAPDVLDVQSDNPNWDVPFVFDVPSPDAPDVPLAVIVVNGRVRCEMVGAPAPVSPSCGDGRAPASHCQQVHYCGGQYLMGHPDAWERWESSNPMLRNDNRLINYPACDRRRATVRSGWVDAYEVSVARVRAWVNAGLPMPPIGTEMGNGQGFFGGGPISVPYLPGDDGDGHTSRDCTYRAAAGMTDELPMNCMTNDAAFAFCYWDNRHVITEEAWEYLASNRATTLAPVGAVPVDQELCRIADVGEFDHRISLLPMMTRVCPPRSAPLSIFATPTDVTTDPPGVYGLMGGLTEVVPTSSTRMPALREREPCERFQAPDVVEGRHWVNVLYYDHYTNKGGSWATFSGRARASSFSASRGTGGLAVGAGFRCARWEVEQR